MFPGTKRKMAIDHVELSPSHTESIGDDINVSIDDLLSLKKCGIFVVDVSTLDKHERCVLLRYNMRKDHVPFGYNNIVTQCLMDKFQYAKNDS